MMFRTTQHLLQRVSSQLRTKTRVKSHQTLQKLDGGRFAPFCSLPVSKPEGHLTCTLIPGDGVGPELMHSVQDVFKAAGVPLDFEEYFLSEVHHHAVSTDLDVVAESIRKNGICLKGTLTIPDFSPTGELGSLTMALRRKLDLFANVVHVKSLAGVETRHRNIDFIIIREVTEGEYSSLEHESVKGVVESLKIVTRAKSLRIAKFAFDYAVKYGRKKVTAVHKANIMKLGDGLFLKCCQEVSEYYPRIQFDSLIIDNCTMQLVSNPHQFDVLVMPNLYGNIVDSLAAGLIGGPSVCSGATFSPDCVVFEPGTRHTFFEEVGRGMSNPTVMFLAATHMLAHVHLDYHAMIIQRAVEKVIKLGKVRTRDLGGYASTRDFTAAVINQLGR
ncbi:unnamed protein product [Darwinula stevensoni]|uniref:Isocitric dehydrogenase subunit beta n=1 Tax=Darwinula stevensoni TaxID=69355 RepID=A0A7R8X9Q5_9CRUS|nr:unnamed protein product [Darwinula stevensoni]CAG0891332.1 unnamed protein product [Darwinula stevensoni]